MIGRLVRETRLAHDSVDPTERKRNVQLHLGDEVKRETLDSAIQFVRVQIPQTSSSFSVRFGCAANLSEADTTPLEIAAILNIETVLKLI